MNFISVNGSIIPANQPAILSNNRGLRYGEGLFETIKIIKGKIPMSKLHFDRLFAGINLLDFKVNEHFNPTELTSEIIALSDKNNCQKLAKARLTVFNGDGELNEQRGWIQYIIECTPLPESINQLNEEGLKIDIYPAGIKPVDPFANLKSSNFLIYSMASGYARKNGLDDCLVLNSSGTIADATIANLFLIKNKSIRTPALTDGCINGVMRRYIIQHKNASGFDLIEKSIDPAELESADEIFLTNAIYGLRWVKQFRQKTYNNIFTKGIYQRLIKTIWE